MWLRLSLRLFLRLKLRLWLRFRFRLDLLRLRVRLWLGFRLQHRLRVRLWLGLRLDHLYLRVRLFSSPLLQQLLVLRLILPISKAPRASLRGLWSFFY